MNTVDHNNVVIFDDRGIPSIMCRFVRPKDTEEVPAVFKIGDKVADAIYISKYPNIVIDGRAYSMPMADPTVNITFDGAVQACRCKGLGWHLMTAVEYEYLLNQSREKGTMPHGNTDWGKDYYHNDEQGKVSNLGRTYTGTGPVTWNHDHTPYGVSDLNGNVWEWLAGLRIKDGVIEFIPDNKAASPYCDLSKDSAGWQQAETSKGPVRANVECGEITITDAVAADDYEPDYDGVRIEKLEVELSEIPQVLKDLGIIPDKRAEEEGKTYVYFDATEGEYMPLRGSAFNIPSSSGASALYLAKVTAVNEKGTHKYHCISQDGKGVYGWVNAESIKELSSKAHSDPASVSKGDIVTFTGGGVYKSSTAEYASVQKNVTSTCKVTAVNTKGTHPYHCISQDGKGVYGWVNAADVK